MADNAIKRKVERKLERAKLRGRIHTDAQVQRFLKRTTARLLEEKRKDG